MEPREEHDGDSNMYMMEAAQKSKRKFEDADSVDRMDEQMGFQRYISAIKRKGWLINVHSVSECPIVSLLLYNYD